MVKYLVDLVTRLLKLKSGIEKNPTTWANQTVAPDKILTIVDGLNKVGKEADDLQAALSAKLAEARRLQAEGEKEADSIESLAIGLEKGSPEKLIEYGISVKKSPSKKTNPTTVLHPSLKDDTDGEGFIVTTTYDSAADMYEWEKGTGADASKTDVVPEMKFFKATKKTSFVDDDVVKGVRYFYRVRATNTAGAGPWSEAVSRVQ